MTGFAGFDAYAYPGAAELAWLKANTNLCWCGYYLAITPSHHDQTWMGQRAALAAAGWGIAPIYVGEQTIPPGSQNPSAAKGAADGAQAAQMMQSEGFPPGACVYLDFEDGPPLPVLMSDYGGAWADAVAAGGYTPGFYGSHDFAASLHQLRPAARIWAFMVSTTQPHPMPGTNFPTLDPAGCGYAGAYGWQLGQYCQITLPGAPGNMLTVDLSTAITADPGAPAPQLPTLQGA